MIEREEFEKQFASTSGAKTDAEKIRDGIMTIAETWPDMLAAWNGMIKQAVDEGWTPEVARSMVLTVIVTDATFFAVTHRFCEGSE